MQSFTRALAALLLPAAVLSAQSDWTSVNQAAVWVNTFVDHGVTERTALWFDGHWRRDGVGADPQQLLLRPGVQVTLRPGLRAAGGYAYIATAPYGESPNARPLREHRTWQQLSVAQAFGGVALSHRVRLEQRWVGAVTGGDVGPLTYQARLRYAARAQRTLGTRATSAGPMLGFVANEFFLPIGHSDGAQHRLQNRAQVGIGLPVSPTQRVELSYMHQWNRITPRTTQEFNHTMVLSWVWTSRVAAAARR